MHDLGKFLLGLSLVLVSATRAATSSCFADSLYPSVRETVRQRQLGIELELIGRMQQQLTNMREQKNLSFGVAGNQALDASSKSFTVFLNYSIGVPDARQRSAAASIRVFEDILDSIRLYSFRTEIVGVGKRLYLASSAYANLGAKAALVDSQLALLARMELIVERRVAAGLLPRDVLRNFDYNSGKLRQSSLEYLSRRNALLLDLAMDYSLVDPEPLARGLDCMSRIDLRLPPGPTRYDRSVLDSFVNFGRLLEFRLSSIQTGDRPSIQISPNLSYSSSGAASIGVSISGSLAKQSPVGISDYRLEIPPVKSTSGDRIDAVASVPDSSGGAGFKSDSIDAGMGMGLLDLRSVERWLVASQRVHEYRIYREDALEAIRRARAFILINANQLGNLPDDADSLWTPSRLPFKGSNPECKKPTFH